MSGSQGGFGYHLLLTVSRNCGSHCSGIAGPELFGEAVSSWLVPRLESARGSWKGLIKRSRSYLRDFVDSESSRKWSFAAIEWHPLLLLKAAP